MLEKALNRSLHQSFAEQNKLAVANVHENRDAEMGQCKPTEPLVGKKRAARNREIILEKIDSHGTQSSNGDLQLIADQLSEANSNIGCRGKQKRERKQRSFRLQ